MHEPPSEQLVRQLTELQLCRPRDLSRARGRVRRLTYDLPAFDSVWIDSLVQLRLLTPYQARQLELGQGDELRIGSLVAIDQLGRSPRGSTYLACRMNRRDRCVVKRQAVPRDRLTAVQAQMEKVLGRLEGFVHPQLVVPHEIIPSEDSELVLISRFVAGLPLNDLLVRRGRFPATVVLEIGRQLLDGLAALHAKSLVHGDIRLSNIRLTDSGLAVLVNGAIRPVINPTVTIHDRFSLDAYDVLAPELIGTGAVQTASSEMYSLGCVLWQLLTGRPPFISADPLAKMAAHQTRAIEDVRAWAPDTPAGLAEVIRQLTSTSPNARPRSFQEVLQQWGPPGSFGRSRLRQFRRLFNGSVPQFASKREGDGRRGWIGMAAALLGLTAGAAVFYDHGLRTELLNVGATLQSMSPVARPSDASTQKTTTTSSPESSSGKRHEGPLPLPMPNDEGVILLTEAGPYEAAPIQYGGRLTIRGVADAEIHVGGSPLNVSATEVVFDKVTIRSLTNDPMVAAITVRSEQLSVINCELLGYEPEADAATQNQEGSPRPATERTAVVASAIAWKCTAGRDPKEGRILIQNSVFHGNGISLLLAQTPRDVQVKNTLKTGSGTFIALGPKTIGTNLSMHFDQVTLRKSGSLLQLGGEFASQSGKPQIELEAVNCAFQLYERRSPLILLDGEPARDDAPQAIALKASESVVEPGTVLFARVDRNANRVVEIDSDEQFEGLVASDIKFAGPQLQRLPDARIAAIQGPRTSESARPGIDPALLGAHVNR